MWVGDLVDLLTLEEEYSAWGVFSHLLIYQDLAFFKNLEGVSFHYLSK